MLEKNIFLFECCEYPVIPRGATIYEKCMEKCGPFDYCCFQECSANESGVLADGKLNVQKAKEIFALQKTFTKFENLTDEWRKVVDESVTTCDSKSHF